MENTRDLSNEWVTSPDRPAPGVAAAIHLSEADLAGLGWQVVSEDVLGAPRYFAVFTHSEANTPLNRARRFTMRHPDQAALGEIWEHSRIIAGTIWRVALLQLEEEKDIEDALCATGITSKQRVLVVAGDGFDAEGFARTLVEDKALLLSDFRLKGIVPWLLRAGLRFGAIIVRPEDGTDARPGLGFYGSRQQIDHILLALHNRAN